IFISAPLRVSQHRVHDLLFVLIGELIGRYCSDQPEYTPDEQRQDARQRSSRASTGLRLIGQLEHAVSHQTGGWLLSSSARR
ncbi:MAG: hypothetical protein WBX35_01605, partial [Pseudolabrys sp.]